MDDISITEVEDRPDRNPDDVWSHLYNTFTKDVKTEGIGTEVPMEGSICNFTITTEVDLPDSPNVYTTFNLKHPIDFTLGEADSEFDKEIEKCLMTMKAGEVSEFSFKFRPSDGKVDIEKLDTSDFKGTIHLSRFVKNKELWEMEPVKKVEICNHHKSKGVEYFQQEKPIWAFYRFSKALKFLLTFNLVEFESGIRSDCEKLKFVCYNNMAACQLLTGKYEHVVKNCTKVLQADTDNVKALFRRGSAYMHLQEFEKAEIDLKQVISMDPHNQAARELLDTVKKRVKDVERGYAEAMRKFLHMDN